MKAVELRIGNIIGLNLKEFPNNYFTVMEVAQQAMKVRDRHESHYFEADDMEGIPLTEEWLKRIDMSTHDCIWHNFASDDGGYFLWVGGHKQYIKYVHTFQNVAFALTGSELTIEKQ